ncbi:MULTISPECIES: threonine synthase [unclassified Fusibacter]|uniref:threonine synthase n=1 Tax=unclassified Fusibacter TaxID=2624464 RepID=UPI001010FC48|nr:MULTISPECIES: threonine synthase [unclassified Fusibacter]MCK8060477.1 threonine synthase [Fusibacter sp. A2]NPE20234.1 threonine synthase [Fusibacter sp. A1]RXV63442.1 threonine synthase [Fusibacter sp. A1]
MNYCSTRNNALEFTFSQAVLMGLAPDGGLFVPKALPTFDFEDERWSAFTYQETAFEVFKTFMSDFSEDQLSRCISAAYDDKFDEQGIAPVNHVEELNLLELFHGRTLAFKDLALSILPHLMHEASKIQGNRNKIAILTATSGDTGKAALEGFSDAVGTEIIVFYPRDGVSEIQKLQMKTQTGSNVHVYGINGNFDDAQRQVKRMLTDESFAQGLIKEGVQLSSANSINIGRLIPQMVYYIHAYFQMVSAGKLRAGEPLNVSVPTGNFGNILAAYYAKECGLPIGKLMCASNQNHVLTEFFDSGIYDTHREFHCTISPSMDILVSSNLERFLYQISEGDCLKIERWMGDLHRTGSFKLDKSMLKEDFYAGFASDEETREAISSVFSTHGYMMDPHTAVAYHVTKKEPAFLKEPLLIVSTASPFKFSEAVLEAIEADSDGSIKTLSEIMAQPVPSQIALLHKQPILHDTSCEVEEMQVVVRDLLMEVKS